MYKNLKYPDNLIAVLFGTEFLTNMPSDCDIALEYIMRSLSDKEYRVMIMRYKDNMTLKDISTEFDVSRERIRQIDAKAIRKLRNRNRSKFIKMGMSGYVDFLLEETRAECKRECENNFNKEKGLDSALDESEKSSVELIELTIRNLNLLQVERDKAVRDMLDEYERKYNNETVKLKTAVLALKGKMSNIRSSIERETNIDSPIDESELGIRPLNLLKRAGYKTIRDILNANSEDIVNIPCMGKKSIEDIIDFLERNGFEWKSSELMKYLIGKEREND